MFITKYEQNETYGPIFQIRAKWNLRATRFEMFITKYEQNETYDPLDFKCLLLNTSKMKHKAQYFK